MQHSGNFKQNYYTTLKTQIFGKPMTNSNSNDRLDRIERAIEDIKTSLAKTKNIVNSNTRSEKLKHETRMQRLENNLLELKEISKALAKINGTKFDT
jgi:archaellum component FlaC